VGSTSTLCPYHHHLKYHAATTPTSDLIAMKCTSSGGDPHRRGDTDADHNHPDDNGGTVSLFPLLVVNSMIPPLPRSMSMHDRRTTGTIMTVSSIASPPSYHDQVASSGSSSYRDRTVGARYQVNCDQTSFICPCPENRLQVDPSLLAESGPQCLGDCSRTPKPYRSVDELNCHYSQGVDSVGDNDTALDLIRYSQSEHPSRTSGCTHQQLSKA